MPPVGGSVFTQPTGVSTPPWISQLESDLGIAQGTPNDTQVFEQWAGFENTQAANNPLATTLGSPASHVVVPGSTPFNSAGVQNYVSPASGLQATAQTIEVNYPQVFADLQVGAPAAQTEADVSNSLWGSHPGTNTQALANPPAFGGTQAQQAGINFGDIANASAFGGAGIGAEILGSQGGAVAGDIAKKVGSSGAEAFFRGFFPWLGISGVQELAIRGMEVIAGAILFAVGLFALAYAASGRSASGDIFTAAKGGAALAAA